MRLPLPMRLPLAALLALLCAARAAAPRFKDVTRAAGIDLSPGRRLKFGGPSVADLDADGRPDLVLCHHGSAPLEVYFNAGRGRFRKSGFGLKRDLHGTTPFRLSPRHRAMRFTVSPGGGAGRRPSHPIMFEVRARSRAVTEVTSKAGITKLTGRGRAALAVDLATRRGANPDLLFTNGGVGPGKCPGCTDPQQFAYENLGNGRFKPVRNLRGYKVTSQSVAVTDVDNDGRMEIISFGAFNDPMIHRVTGPFQFNDISRAVFPRGLVAKGVVAVAEADFDNDGHFDLYLARDKQGFLSQLRRGAVYPDVLLRNRGGRYVDVTRRAGIPTNTISRGVTAADFNNDGHVDLFLTVYDAPDLLLLNNGDGTFRRVPRPIPRPKNVRGDMAAAVDYDADGRVDLVVGQGDQFDPGFAGHFRIFRNKLKRSPATNYLLVRVANAPGRGATSLHAVVTVVAGNRSMKRRVGSPGTQVASSYIELLHFGLGRATRADKISVRWTNGKVATRKKVPAGSKILIGVV